MENIPVRRPEAMEVAAIILTMYHGGLEVVDSPDK